MPPETKMSGVEGDVSRPARRPWNPFQSFFGLEAASGIVLVVCALVALVWANSPFADGYFRLRGLPLGVTLGERALVKSLTLWINDGLMALFFFMVGLEIKREILGGELASVRTASLAAAGAAGGVVLPALVFTAFNRGGPGEPGWAIPMATDIAFALGALALVGARAPVALRVFLSALAIIDDLVAVVVIAIFYTARLDLVALTVALGLFGLLLAVARSGRVSPAVLVVLGTALWLATLRSGVHATVAGILTALAVPHRKEPGSGGRRAPSMLETIEHSIQPWIAFGVLPLFALANAGVVLPTSLGEAASEPITVGVFLGLVVGKPLGIFAFVWLAVRSGVAELPGTVTWRHLHGAAWLCGIGFTMSLFIGGLAFEDASSLELAKLAVLAGSLVSGCVGWWILRTTSLQGRVDGTEPGW